MCLAHCSEEEKATALKQVSESRKIDARGVILQDALLAQILAAIPHGADDELLIEDCQFDHATFKGDALFGGVTFKGDARFGEATFKGYAAFPGARFEGDARFDAATFEGVALFDWAHFKGDAWFDAATFDGVAVFGAVTEAHFEDDARFDRAATESGAKFEGNARFDRAATESGAKFEGNARFGGATFGRDAWFTLVTVKGDALFGGATFQGDVPLLGPITVGEELVLDRVKFTSTVRIEADAKMLTCRLGGFPGGVRLNVHRAVIRLDGTDLSVPSLLTGPPAWAAVQPKLLSLQGANVAGLALGNVSLADCRFAGAHNLDKLRLEADTAFGLSPAVAGWERRQVIAEEAAWRADTGGPGRWMYPPWPASEEPPPQVLSPGVVAGLYRALRKGREDAKDEPGAADFYYGEMEMRRHTRPASANKRRRSIRRRLGAMVSGLVKAYKNGKLRPWRRVKRTSPEGTSLSPGGSRGRVERGILTAYWLVSGYGLRANRAVAWLAAITALLALGFWLFGFSVPPHPDTYWTSLLYSFRATLSLTDSDVKLTAWGQLLQGILRLTGPVLLGLALLALRGRVKR